MPENLSRFSEVPQKETKPTPPFVPPEEMNQPARDMRETIYAPGSPEAKTHEKAAAIARLLGHNDPRLVEQGLNNEDRATVYGEPPTSVR